MSTIAEFDEWAQTYDKDVKGGNWVGPRVIFDQVSRLPFCDAFRIQAGENPTRKNQQEALKILDWGIGTGLSITPFTDAFHCDTTGIDYSGGMLQECERVLAGKGQPLRLIEGDVTDAEQHSLLRDSSFDLVLSAGLLEFIPPEGVQIIIDQSFRVLKPGGLLALVYDVGKVGLDAEGLHEYQPSEMVQMCRAFNQMDLVPDVFRGYGPSLGWAHVKCGAYFGQKPAESALG